MAKYECEMCGFIYDEAEAGTLWDNLPDDWLCEDCGAGKNFFKKLDA